MLCSDHLELVRPNTGRDVYTRPSATGKGGFSVPTMTPGSGIMNACLMAHARIALHTLTSPPGGGKLKNLGG